MILGWYHWPCNIDDTKYRFNIAAKIDRIVILELAATDLRNKINVFRGKNSADRKLRYMYCRLREKKDLPLHTGKTLDWGERGGKGGAMRVYQKWFCTTPYYLEIAEDKEG